MEHKASKEKVKMQINSACHDIDLYVTACKQEFWSTGIDIVSNSALSNITNQVADEHLTRFAGKNQKSQNLFADQVLCWTQSP